MAPSAVKLISKSKGSRFFEKLKVVKIGFVPCVAI